METTEIKSFKEIHKELMQPIPYKFRLQSMKYGKATVVSYIDSRQLQDRLDEVVGAENWQVRYEEIKGNLYASIGIMTTNGWVWKSDCGTESNVEKEKGEASDSFKRAGVMWGVGRFLYSLPIIELKTAVHKLQNGKEKEYPADEQGKILWSSDDLNKYCWSLVNKEKSGENVQKQPSDINNEGVGDKTKPSKTDLYPGILDKWNAAKDFIKGYDGLVFDAMDSIKKKYNLTPENEALLLKEAKGIESIEIPQETIDAINSASTSEELTNIWNELTGLHTSREFISIWEQRRKEILLPNKNKKAA